MDTSSKSDLSDVQKAEAEFFNESARRRSKHGRIPFQADIRRATRVVYRETGDEPVDPKMYNIQQKRFRDRYLTQCAHTPGGRVLDICCGPGWLALELGRRGQHVDAYDISPDAISLARQMLDENPYKEGFGSVTYHLEDVSKVDLGVETLDAISGWSAFHHLPDLEAFIEKAYRALKPGGIIATVDDYEQGALENWLLRLSLLAVPTYDRSYADKAKACWNRLLGRSPQPVEIFSPAEMAKYSTVWDINRIWRTKFELIESYSFNAFAITPMQLLAGPDWFRYPVAHLLDAFDQTLLKTRICKPNIRMLIARKPLR